MSSLFFIDRLTFHLQAQFLYSLLRCVSQFVLLLANRINDALVYVDFKWPNRNPEYLLDVKFLI